MAWGDNPDKILIDKHEYGHLLLARDAAQMLIEICGRDADGGHMNVAEADLEPVVNVAREAVERDRCKVCRDRDTIFKAARPWEKWERP